MQKKILDTTDSPIDVFARLVDTHENCFLLETLHDKDQPQTTSRSYIGIAPQRVFTARDGDLFIDGRKKTVQNPYFALHDYIQTDRTLAPGYIGGLVGYVCHEGVTYFEPTITFEYERQFPDFQFGEYRDGVVFAPGEAPEYFYHDQDRSDMYLGGSTKLAKLAITFEGAEKTQADHAKMVAKAQTDIQNGRVFQVVLANTYRYSFTGDLLELYRTLRQINPSPYMFFVKFGDFITMGASPELLSHVKPNGHVYLEALAGTTRRGKTPEEDKQLEQKLLADKKELAEHAMLVDLARNDIGRISRPGSVEVEKLMYIKKLSHVQHICSIVRGTLDDAKYDMFDALASNSPAGTLTGAPKVEACKLIAELERSERGPYGGTIGYFSYNGDSMHGLNIRSVSAVRNQLLLLSGSGIVYDSQAEREFTEIGEKKAAMDRAMKEFLT